MATAKRPGKKRQYRGGMLPKLLTVVAAVAAIVIGVMIFFKVQTVSVVGNVRYTTQSIIEASGIAIGENLMTLNKAAAQLNITTRLPYVDEVRMVRQMPDTVIIEVTECDSAAVIADESGEEWLISPSCKITEQVTEQTTTDLDGLTRIEGALAVSPAVGMPLQMQTPEQLTALQSLLPALERTTLLPSIRTIDLAHTYELVLYYEDRFDVQLGGTDQLEYKITYLQEIVLNQLDETKTGTIDLTLEESGEARLIPW